MGSRCVTEGAPPGAPGQPRGWDGLGDERQAQKGGDIRTPMTDSCRYRAETNTIS